MKNLSVKQRNASAFFSKGAKIMLLMLITCSMLGTFSSCNSKKKMAANDLETRLDKAKQQLTAILEDDGSMSIESMESQLNSIKSQDFDNPYVKKLEPKVKEIKELITKVEKKIANEKEKKIDEINSRLQSLINDNSKSASELERELNEIRIAAKKYSNAETQRLIKQLEDKIESMKNIPTTDEVMDLYFDNIVAMSKRGDVNGANAEIQKTLTLFESGQTPVLIIIAIEGTIIDYDKPTTIEAYLNYLKDQKINRNSIKEIEKTTLGKIKLLTLIKK